MTCSSNCTSNCGAASECTCGATDACNCTCLPSTGTPYYNQACGCQESHQQVIVKNQYVPGVTVANSFNLPVCTFTAILTVPGLQAIPIGSYLWNPSFGYLKIISFDFASSTIVVQNECQSVNAPAGTLVPACTLFTISAAPGLEDPCATAAVTQGALVVCKNGVMQPLDADFAGQVPVSVDASSNEVEFQTLDVAELVCTELTAAIVLVAGSAGPYTLNVSSSAGFALGDIIKLGTLSHRFVITGIPSGIQITVALITTPPAGNQVVSAGVSVCQASCCETMEYWRDNPCDWDLSGRARVTEGSITSATMDPISGTLLPGQNVISNPAVMVVTNPLCTPMLVMIDVNYESSVSSTSLDPAWGVSYRIHGEYDHTTGPIGASPAPVLAPLVLYTVYRHYEDYGVAISRFNTDPLNYHRNAIVPAGFEIKINSRLRIYYDQGTAVAPPPDPDLAWAILYTTIKVAVVNV